MKSALLRRIAKKARRHYTNRARSRSTAWLEDYFRRHELDTLLATARDKSESSGVYLWDYYVLHEAIRLRKPKFVLECGTGLSTWVIAKALQKYSKPVHGEAKVVSMENYERFHARAIEIFPDELREHADICLSDIESYNYAFINGTVYSDVPDHPYSFLFVDGPEQKGTSNMQFVKVVESATEPVSAIVDHRLQTIYAYACLFGRQKVHYNPVYELGVVSPVTKKDLLLERALVEDWDGAPVYGFQLEQVANQALGVGFSIDNSIRSIMR